MRVCLLVNRVGGGGAELVGLRWAQGLADRGHDVLLLTYDDPNPGAVEGVRTVGHPCVSRSRRLLDLPGWVRQQIRDHGSEAAVGVMTFANLVLQSALAGTGIPVVLSEHNLPSNLRAEGRGGRAKDGVARATYRRADAVVACSHSVAACMSARYGVPTDRLWIVPNPAGGVPRNLPVGPGGRLLFVGRLVAQKRPDVFVDVLAALACRGRPTDGVVLGDGPLADRMRERAVRQGVSLELRGWQPDWRSHARAGDVVVLPSLQEGFGNVLVEAAECGLASVAVSQALGVADALLPGVTGVLSPSGSAEHLCDAVEHAWLLPSPDRAQVASWSSRFSAASAAHALEQVLQAVRR
jgi:glycosyltransferase involved in cell wall biosynthesis